jgi:dTDP-glucose 4,6-dehydratase
MKGRNMSMQGVGVHILVTGSAGFIGSALRRFLASETDDPVANVDKLTYAGNLDSLRPTADSSHYHFVQADNCERLALDAIFAEFEPEAESHPAAETQSSHAASLVNA